MINLIFDKKREFNCIDLIRILSVPKYKLSKKVKYEPCRITNGAHTCNHGFAMFDIETNKMIISFTLCRGKDLYLKKLDDYDRPHYEKIINDLLGYKAL